MIWDLVTKQIVTRYNSTGLSLLQLWYLAITFDHNSQNEITMLVEPK